jgi:hypothetical protein
MANDNGQSKFGKQLAALAAAHSVPIVGLPFVLEGWLVQILLTCKCTGGPRPVLIIGQPGAAVGQCPGCQSFYTLLSIGLNPAGQPSFNVAMTAPPSAPNPADAGGSTP